MTNQFPSAQFNYSYNVWTLKFITHSLVHFYYPVTILYVGTHIFLFMSISIFRFYVSGATGYSRGRNAGFSIQQFHVLPTQLYLCVLCGSQNKQRLFPYTTLTGWFL